jgi:hypothetical protein
MASSTGDITTLLDITPRDRQDNDFFPLTTQDTWFTRDPDRRHIPAVPFVADFPFRGPASFGQRFTFDLGSMPCGDLIFGAALQIRLSHWLDRTTQLLVEKGTFTYKDAESAWFYCNSLGTAIIQKAELEINGSTVEEIDGDFINTFSRLFADLNIQVGISTDHLGRVSLPRLLGWNPARLYPVEDGVIHCILPFFFMRNRLREALPMIAIAEGSVKIHVVLRPFGECLRQRRGYRDDCTSIPLNRTITFRDTVVGIDKSVKTVSEIPQFQDVRLLTFGSLLSGKIRESMLRNPFEILHRNVQTFSFAEPLKYVVAKNTTSDTVKIQLPLEANHPLEEIIWFIRRTDVEGNNEWTNYSSVLEKDYDPTFNPLSPLLVSAAIQVNGITLCDAEEIYYRDLIARHHRGGIVPFNSFIYGYPFARHPGEHQPSGTLNASRVQNLRLVLEVKNPGVTWEVKVFCCALNWLRFQNGIANPVFQN